MNTGTFLRPLQTSLHLSSLPPVCAGSTRLVAPEGIQPFLQDLADTAINISSLSLQNKLLEEVSWKPNIETVWKKEFYISRHYYRQELADGRPYSGTVVSSFNFHILAGQVVRILLHFLVVSLRNAAAVHIPVG